jgi:hypothetical protein
MAAELAAAEARLASSQDVAHLRTAGEWWDVTTVAHVAAGCQCIPQPLVPSAIPNNTAMAAL